MNIIQAKFNDKKSFVGSVVITETVSDEYRKITSSQPSDVTVIYEDSKHRRYGEYVKKITTKDFIHHKDNSVSIVITDAKDRRFCPQKITQFRDIPRNFMESIRITNQYRPLRIVTHLELPYIINYAINRKHFMSVVRKFVYVYRNAGDNYDLWIVENGDLTWKLIKVHISPISLDIEYTHCDIFMETLEKFECPENFITAYTGYNYIRESRFKSFEGSSDIKFTCNDTDDTTDPRIPVNLRIINNWIQSECCKHIRTKLPNAIQAIIVPCFMPMCLLNLIVEYSLPRIDNVTDLEQTRESETNAQEDLSL